jgi:hypothetical protein
MADSPPPAAAYRHPLVRLLAARLAEEHRFLQVVVGPRQVGKTTAVRQALAALDVPSLYASADDPGVDGREWLRGQWDLGRQKIGPRGAVLVLDEIQKVRGWPEIVKALWDEDTQAARRLRVVVVGPGPVGVQRDLAWSLAGRFEVVPATHWGLDEMAAAFGWDAERFVLFGGYPGAAPLVDDEDRWRRYVRDSLVESTLARDILRLTRVDKPALLHRLLDLGCRHAGHILSYNRMLGLLTDAGNTTTLANYLALLSGAGVLAGLGKFTGRTALTRASSPKLLVRNTALATAASHRSPAALRADPETWGLWLECAVGAHLLNGTIGTACEVLYWRDPKGREVDFVLARGADTVAIEVQSGRTKGVRSGLGVFADRFRPRRTLLVGAGGVPVDDFLRTPPERWLA